MKLHGDTVAGKKLEFIRKDVGGVAPDPAKRLAQELVVREHADIFTGFALTLNALAAGDRSAEAKKFMVVMNAGPLQGVDEAVRQSQTSEGFARRGVRGAERTWPVAV